MTADVAGPLDRVMTADSAFGAEVERAGIAAALRLTIADNAVLVYPGANVIAGREQIVPRLREMPLEVVRARAATWQPIGASVSDDDSIAASWGILRWRADSSGNEVARASTYITAWSRSSSGRWQIAAIVWTATPSFLRDDVPGPAQTAADTSSLTSAERGMWEADAAFARLAGDSGAPTAFARFAATNAFTFPGPGLMRRGPEEIRAGLAGGPLGTAGWSWHPVIARASDDGTLGFTVGLATIEMSAERTLRSKYLTVWRRQPGGEYRFLTDAGNGRP